MAVPGGNFIEVEENVGSGETVTQAEDNEYQ